jgi:hypothetical protein
MRLPRFTIRQLIGLIVICAVFLALLRTQAGPFILALVVPIGIVLPGFLIDRARGGEGILGGALAGGVVLVGFGSALAALMPGCLGPAPLTLLLLGSAGLYFGTLVSQGLWIAVEIARSLFVSKPLVDQSFAPDVPRSEEQFNL